MNTSQKRTKNLILAIVGAAQLMDALDMAIMNVSLPSIFKDLKFTSLSALQWVASVYVLACGGFLILGGRVADTFGRKRTFMLGTLVFTAASFLTGAAQSDLMIIAARGLQGISAAFMSPAALSIVLTTFAEGKERNRALGIWGAIGASGAIVGMVFGGILTTYWGWRWCFFINIFIGLAVVLLTAMFVPADVHAARHKRRIDLLGSTLITGGLVALVYALTEAATAGWQSARTLWPLAGSFVLLGAFIANERHGREALLPLDLFKIKNISSANLIYLGNTAAFSSVFFFPTLYMQNQLHFTALQTGLAFLPTALTAAATAALVSRVISKIGFKLPMVTGLCVSAIGLSILATLPLGGTYVHSILPGFIVIALGVGATMVSVTIAATNGVPNEKSGIASGILGSNQQIGMALGLAALAGVASASTANYLAGKASGGLLQAQAQIAGYHSAFYAAIGIVLACALLAVLGIRQPREGLAQFKWKLKIHG